jgi:2-keto-4-pentenoate hydratase
MVEDVTALIDAFWDANARGDYFPAAYYDQLSLDQAYRVQLGLIGRRVAGGERQIGWKVGLTAKAIQQQFNVHEPVFGCILESAVSGHRFAPSDLIHPGFENELCVRLSHDLSGQITPAQARAAVACVYPSLEIIETRGPLSEQLALALADNAQQKTVILGAPVALPDMLETIEARVTVNGALVGSGLGEAVLGNPLNSIVWLAAKVAEYGRVLRAGEIIMTGSFTRQFPINPGDVIRTEFSGVGMVEVAMAAA